MTSILSPTTIPTSSTPTTTITTAAATSPSRSNSLRQSTLRKNMSVTQTYFLAHKARAKLSHEAAQPDHDLRLLVGHANLLDSLMIELADAEREQERWFNQSVRGAASSKSQDRHIQWADSVVEEVVSADDVRYVESDSDSSDDDYDEDDITMVTPAVIRPTTLRPTRIQVDEVMEDDDLEEDYAQLELVRTPSHSASPPELVEEHESDSSEDESMPPSPPTHEIVFVDGKAAKEQDSPSQEQQDSFFADEAYFLTPSSTRRASLVSAISVY